MARAIWSGAVSFGLVNVPVKLYSATAPKDIRFHEFQEGTGKRIRHERVAEGTDEEVPYEEVVKGYEYSDGGFVTLTQEELEAAEPERTRSIAIEDFVELADVDPIYFRKTYFLAPDTGAEKPYALLLRAMEDTGRVGIARFVFRTKEHLAAIRPIDGILGLETLFFADEVRMAGDIEGVPVDADVADREVEMARQLIGSMAGDWQPERYEDTYRERVLELIERKASGERIVAQEAPRPGKVGDLMAALKASVEDAKQRQGSATGSEGGSDLEGWPRDRLYEEAQRRKIRGRSQMSKDELVEALGEVS